MADLFRYKSYASTDIMRTLTAGKKSYISSEGNMINAEYPSNRLYIPNGEKLNRTIVEFYYKDDALQDPLVSEEHIITFGWASQNELDEITSLALRINDFLAGYFSAIKIQLVDFKIEFGRLYKNDEVYVVLADEISPDSCRLWDSQTKQKMDKDVYRENSGYLLDGYNEVAKRMGLLTQNGASKNKKPTLVKG